MDLLGIGALIKISWRCGEAIATKDIVKLT
jgi:hypothetical protein